MSLSLQQISSGLRAGEKPALARALSLAERDPAAAAELLRLLSTNPGHAHVLGITGPPGAGKSTLVGALVRTLLGQGKSVAVLAVDPSSPVSGGALLGDRFRIGEAIEGRCFVRSTATRGSLGGLTAAAQQMVRLMDLAGYDLVIVETVGTGQSEIDVARLADTLAVVFPPALGDEMQAIKAGILELADLLVVTKSDTPAARQACDSLRGGTHLWRRAPPILPVSALSGDGIAELAGAILDRAAEGVTSRRTTDSPTALSARFAALWVRVQAGLPQAAPLRAILNELPTGGLQIEILAPTTGQGVALGMAAGAIALLAADEKLALKILDADPGGTRLIFELH